jgi:hypothetical protein
MDIAEILFEIDAEIERLGRIRTIVEGLAWPPPRKQKKPRRRQPIPRELVIAAPRLTILPPKPTILPPKPTILPPKLTILPPKPRSEYRRKRKTVSEPRALSSAVPEKPVFVPRAAVRSELVTNATEFGLDALEAALRQNLLGRSSVIG